MPIDSRGDTVADWLNSPPMVRRDFVPREAVLGKGMFGTVWRAMDLRSRQWYAVKRSNTSRQPTIAREREVTNHVLMNPHPCIVQIFGNHYIETGSCFSSLVMEFCAGGDLQDKVNEAHTDHGYRLPDQAVTWLGQIFLGLVTWIANWPSKAVHAFGRTVYTRTAQEHLHMVLGTLQRDLKPRNVVFSDDGRAKLTDFGMGRIGASTAACPAALAVVVVIAAAVVVAVAVAVVVFVVVSAALVVVVVAVAVVAFVVVVVVVVAVLVVVTEAASSRVNPPESLNPSTS